MIDVELMKRHFQPGELAALGDVLQVLYGLNVFKIQADQNTLAIVKGFSSRTPEELSKEILQVQQTNRNLLALHEVAGNFKDKINAHSES